MTSKNTETTAAKKTSKVSKASAASKRSSTGSTSPKTSKKTLSAKKSVSPKVPENAKNLKSSRQNKKRTKVTLTLALVLLAIIAALYFLRPDLFYSGKKIVFDYLGIQQTEKTFQGQSQEESQNGKSGSESASGTISENQKHGDKSISESAGAKNRGGKTETQKPLSPGNLSEENLPLYFGNPSGATTEVKNAANYLIEKAQFSMSYNSEKLIPNWVIWHLDKDDMGDAERGDDFRPDAELPENFYGVKKADYQYTQFGFDRGHVCPSADRTSSEEDNSATFLMTNMIPQSPNCNRNVWKNLESYERELALNGKELYIAAGPFGKGGTSDKGTFDEIPLKNGQAIEVPSYCWKIIMILDEGENDFERVDTETEILAAWIPNSQKVSERAWDYYITTVDFIEEQTGHDFFALLPDEIEDTIESRKYDYAE